ncbi:hypothetical protein EON63_18895 [archaeon]|nr:MAG: hypothetical protein EON63_18895 [archaeon]
MHPFVFERLPSFLLSMMRAKVLVLGIGYEYEQYFFTMCIFCVYVCMDAFRFSYHACRCTYCDDSAFLW